MEHSKIVGGSTAKRVIACPGSVALVDTVPPKPSSSYADEGTLLHDTIATILERDIDPYSMVGTAYEKTVLTEALVDDKLIPALRALDEIDPKGRWNMLLRAGLVLVIFCLTFLVLPIFLVAWVIERLFWIGSLVMAWLSKSKKTRSYSSTLRLLNARRIRHGLSKTQKKSN